MGTHREVWKETNPADQKRSKSRFESEKRGSLSPVRSSCRCVMQVTPLGLLRCTAIRVVTETAMKEAPSSGKGPRAKLDRPSKSWHLEIGYVM
jgi:hypothetical protein